MQLPPHDNNIFDTTSRHRQPGPEFAVYLHTLLTNDRTEMSLYIGTPIGRTAVLLPVNPTSGYSTRPDLKPHPHILI